jgi:hypothetical protein
MKRGKMKFGFPLLFFAVIILPHSLKSQTFVEVHANQPPALIANAGQDISIDAGMSLTLGGTPAATGGTGNIWYFWSPSYYIDQLAVSNPLATPPGNVTYTLMVSDVRGCYGSDEIVVTVIGGTGMAEKNADEELSVYPNPSHGALTLEMPDNRGADLQVSVVTITGQIVHNEILKNTGTSMSVSIDLSSLPKGSYILLISSDSSEIFRQIILN